MRLWFNRGYSLASIAGAMMAGNPSLEVFISTGEGLPQREGAARSWIEPNLPDDEYLAWVERQITDHGIDIFVPTRRRGLIAGASLPCEVVLPTSIDILDILADKHAFAAALMNEPFFLPTFSAACADDMQDALDAFQSCHGPDTVACVKPRYGVNGHGFWALDATSPTAHIIDPERRSISPEMFIAAMRAEERASDSVRPFVLMEFLPGPEVSFDVLAHKRTVLRSIARTKLESSQLLQSSHPLQPAVQSLVARFGLSGLINVQFRQAVDGSWKALEINARPAGGSIYAEQFGGRLIADWGGLLTGRITPDQVDRTPLDIEIAFENNLSLVG